MFIVSEASVLGLSPLVVEGISVEGELVGLRARPPDVWVACPGCDAESSRVHDYHERTSTDLLIDERRVLVRVRRLVCPTHGC
ncbi:hypothetical protein MXD62_26865 [Frankia sp. Mgl5]|uniref:transposase family protein n=1 Tax=Frankia sp. Mgl5 TaxID=2933793 RepID=UPI00200FA003|nr:transposase family protein [Frankia sp. Mgl5]MCK9930730.1 hypothetical protein [Frankia sp. Mgl5]